MADYTQTQNTIISHQNVTNPESVEGTAVDVRAALSALVIVRHAYREAVDPGGAEPEIHIMASLDQTASPPDESWFKVLTLKATDPGATVATEAMTATEPTGETVLAVANTTGFAAGDEIYVEDTGTPADSEWHLVDRIVSNTSVDIFMGLTNAKDSSDVLWGSAQTFRVPLDLSGIGHITAHYSNEATAGTPANTAIFVEALVATDFV